MSQPPSSTRSLLTKLLWHCLMGITLGVICAGLLLQIGGAYPHALIHTGDTMLARLQFLLSVAFFFGFGATLTGATFLANEKKRT